MWAMHVGMAAGVGALRGVMAFAGLRGPWASAMFTVVRLTADQTVENWTGVGAPPWTWPRDELLVDVAGKAVYAFVTGAVADRLAAAAGVVARASGTPSSRAADGARRRTGARRARRGCDRRHPAFRVWRPPLGILNGRVPPGLAPRLHGRSRHSRPEFPAAHPERTPMLTLHPHDLVRPDATIRYWTGGDTGPTVVLLHGATLDHRAWARRSTPCADGSALVVPDLRGHGASTGRFDFEDAVQDVLALLDALPAAQVVLVGLSLGAQHRPGGAAPRPGPGASHRRRRRHVQHRRRAPVGASMTVAALHAQAQLTGDRFARYAARTTALDPQVQGTPSRPTRTAPTGRPSRSSLAAHHGAAPRAGLSAAGPRAARPRRPRPPRRHRHRARGVGRSGSRWPSTP